VSFRRRRIEGELRRGAEELTTSLDRRLPVSEGGSLLRKAFPEHWTFLLGEIALYSFVVLLLTGVYLTFFFEPSISETVYRGSYGPLRGLQMSHAYASTLEISFDVRGGLLVRQAHHWAADIFLAAIGIHMARMFFTGAFRRPRETNWIIGVTLFALSMFEGFCGYSLPDDLLSGTGLRVAQGIVLSVPVIGSYLSFFIFGGQYPGAVITQRLYITHVLLIPALLAALITVHLILVVYLKHTQWAQPGKSNRNVVGTPMFPQFAARSTGLMATVAGLCFVFAAIAQINPIWDYGPYVTSQVSNGAEPDWYIGWLIGGLRLTPPAEVNFLGHTLILSVFVPGVLLPLTVFAALYLYPFFERWVTGDTGEHHLCDRPRNHPVRTGLGVAGIVFYAVLLAAGGDDIIALTFDLSVNWLRWLERILLFLAPVAAFLITRKLCHNLQQQDATLLEEGKETGRVRQAVHGGFSDSHRPLPAAQRYVILAREPAKPVTAQELGAKALRAPRRTRLRTTLSAWFFSGRAEMPAPADTHRDAVQVAAGQPGRDAVDGSDAEG
jgi:ubiquinol-cytochrome c reductase cytochrome b subunit